MRTSILFILICYANLFAQISQGGTPKYFEEEIQLDYIEVNRNNLVDRNFAPMVFQFGDEYQINISKHFIIDSYHWLCKCECHSPWWCFIFTY